MLKRRTVIPKSLVASWIDRVDTGDATKRPVLSLLSSPHLDAGFCHLLISRTNELVWNVWHCRKWERPKWNDGSCAKKLFWDSQSKWVQTSIRWNEESLMPNLDTHTHTCICKELSISIFPSDVPPCSLPPSELLHKSGQHKLHLTCGTQTSVKHLTVRCQTANGHPLEK